MVPAAVAVVATGAEPYLTVSADTDAARHQAGHDALAYAPGISEVGRLGKARVAPPCEGVAVLAGKEVRVAVASRETAGRASVKMGADANGPVEASVPGPVAVQVGARREAGSLATRHGAPPPAVQGVARCVPVAPSLPFRLDAARKATRRVPVGEGPVRVAAVDPAVPGAAVPVRHLATPAAPDVVPHQASRVATPHAAAVGEDGGLKVATGVTSAAGVLRVAMGELRLQVGAGEAVGRAAGAIGRLAVGTVSPDIAGPGATGRRPSGGEGGRVAPSVRGPARAVGGRARRAVHERFWRSPSR